MFLLRARMAVVSSVRARVCACVNRPSWLFSTCVRHPSAQALAYTTHCVYPLRVSVHHPSSQVHVRFVQVCLCALIGAVIASQRVCTQFSACVSAYARACMAMCVKPRIYDATGTRAQVTVRVHECQTLRLQSVFAKRWYATTRAAP